MKIDWPKKRFIEFCELKKGRKPTVREVSLKGDLPYLIAKQLRGGECAQFASPTDKNSVLVQSGEIIIICDGSNSGETFIGFAGVLSSTMAKVTHSNEIETQFLRYFLESRFQEFNESKTGSAIPHLDLDALRELPIPLPPIAEQRRIIRMLDSACADIALAMSLTEESRENTRALFESQLHSGFTRRGPGWTERTLREVAREFGRGKSKHRPRGDPRLLGGIFPLIQTGDIANAKQRLTKYSQTYNEVGLAQSRLWPRETVCIAIVGANVAETAILDFDACFPDSVIGLVVDPNLADAEYVQFLLSAFKAELKEKGKGTARDNINIATFENQRFPFPTVARQKIVVAHTNALYAETLRLDNHYMQKLAALEELKAALFQSAFSGSLAKTTVTATVVPFPQKVAGISTTDLHAGLLALAFEAHEKEGKLSTFGHVKAEKIAHMVESYIGLDLGRTPMKDAAGPNDFPHLQKVEHRARMACFFDFRPEGARYQVIRLGQFDKLVHKTKAALAGRTQDVEALLDLMVPMTTQQAEVLSTVYAAWNNLLLDKGAASDAEIVSEARENWHPAKLTIPREKFVAAMDWLRKKNMAPTGKGKRVETKQTA